ncbi:DUF3741 domain-containing protein [Clostridium paraputrificum]|uniref:DUF3741 domain-containing protein n=1 Tax=Clostridium paraputrificum TaxID=29363 RepID=UPI00041E60F5|nr:DUF3741 domain-containing protein [Clostridium paraputrificum]
MNIFTVKGEEKSSYKISREKYEEVTKKDKVYFRDDGKHYALCPACLNPIYLVNIYNNEEHEKGTRRQTQHGRHIPKSFAGLAEYNKQAYDNCPLGNPKAFGIEGKRRNKQECNEIIEIINNNKDLLLKYIRNITGIYFSNSLLNKLLDYFKDVKGEYYEYINIYNLPYSFLYMQRKINIFGQWLKYNTIGDEIKKAIQKKSKSYEIKNNKITKIPGTKYAQLSLALFEHKIYKDGKQSIEVRIYEEIDKNESIIFKKTILIDMGSFISEVERK